MAQAQDLDLQDADSVCRVFHAATEASLSSPTRRGSTEHLPAKGRLLVTGDLHDHSLNFQRILALAGLERQSDHHLILQEVIHGPYRVNGLDLSIRMLARVADLKQRFPAQVHILLGNHELSQMLGRPLAKGSVNVTEAYDAGIDYLYGDASPRVRAAMDAFIRSQLLAVRCPNGIMLSHSLPSASVLGRFDPAVIDRQPTIEDFQSTGSAYALVWGRSHPPQLAARLRQAWGNELFILGHQPAEMGYEIETEGVLIINSDHSHGMALPVDLSRKYDLHSLIDALIPLAGVEV